MKTVLARCRRLVEHEPVLLHFGGQVAEFEELPLPERQQRQRIRREVVAVFAVENDVRVLAHVLDFRRPIRKQIDAVR